MLVFHWYGYVLCDVLKLIFVWSVHVVIRMLKGKPDIRHNKHYMFSKYWCHIFQINYELDVTGFVSKYWCHIFQIDYELDVIDFAVRDYSGIFN